jgi:hypothetical protein
MVDVDPTKPADLVDLGEYAKQVGLAKQTVWRWCRVGVGGKRLPCLIIGNRLKTSNAALAEFIAAIQPAGEASNR